MAEVIELFHHASFDPETVKTLCDAYDRVRKSLHDSGQPELVNEVIARRILALASQGERDPDRICEAALKVLGIAPRRNSLG